MAILWNFRLGMEQDMPFFLDVLQLREQEVLQKFLQMEQETDAVINDGTV